MGELGAVSYDVSILVVNLSLSRLHFTIATVIVDVGVQQLLFSWGYWLFGAVGCGPVHL